MSACDASSTPGPGSAGARAGRAPAAPLASGAVRRAVVILAMLLGLSVALSACDAQFSPWAARVDGASISRDALNATLDGVASNAGYTCLTGTQPVHGAGGTSTYDAQLSANLLTVLVEARAFDAVVQRRHLVVGSLAAAVAADEIASSLTPPTGSSCRSSGAATFAGFAPVFRDSLRSLYAARAVLAADLAGTSLTRASVAAYAAAHPNETSLACVSVIVAKSQGTAAAAAAKIAAGESFASVARTYSSDQSAQSGGALGCLPPSALPPAAASVVEALPIGQLSAAVAYQGEYLLLLVTARKRETPTEVAASIVQTKAAAAQALLSKALARARVEIDPMYGTWSKTASGYAVATAKGPASSELFNLGALTPPAGGVGAG